MERRRFLALGASIASMYGFRTSAFASAFASDWPQFRGPMRNGISAETGLLKTWPASGPPQLWMINTLGQGYGSLAIKGDRVFVQGSSSSASILFCLNRADGKVIWQAALGPKVDEGRGNGPRGTPAIDVDRAYVLTENGDLACLRVRDGSPIWRKNILKDFGGKNPGWLISESPLIDGNRVIVTPGGPNASVVALDKMTGATVWTSTGLSDGAHYASPIAADIGGVRTIMTFTSRSAVGLRASDGKLMWTYRPAANGTANITTPVFADSKVFFTSAYGTGCALLELKAQGGEVKATEVYFSKEMQNHHGGVVLVGGHVYGFSNAILTCLEYTTGKVMWKDRSVGKGAVVYADGHLYLLSENNVVGLAEATPAGYKETGRFTIPDQGWPSWAHPVVSDGRLYLRNQGWLACYDVKAR
ncbi:MAG: PQQ-like beta-propeller repeat protein [Acidobacteria bacterium]|nr:PQQ-like beta-propeller repeat protein [Acidobacteriota bacterium]MCW5970943.1 PQQ-like beta-propeller repeat protein [Blastocatellales bacterium]